ncbi:hypothetical protein BN137_3666 [Cronobacter condimenti 1330]|uniref:Uncharacterized protein n=1 Tax=Cronobacter condimenti 1330 TaxID=1073999 RepID=K8A309_9ENTR|nr:hypothetical protein BN137_3666 [Cronobacter condimenti 1330]
MIAYTTRWFFNRSWYFLLNDSMVITTRLARAIDDKLRLCILFNAS